MCKAEDNTIIYEADQSKVLSKHFENLLTLDAFINDEVINAFLGIITEHEWGIYYITSFWYTQLENKSKG